MQNKGVKHDIHIHTHLSACASREAFIKDYVPIAKSLGLKTIGFADHSWEASIEGASDWYKPQTYERLAARKEEIKEIDTEGITILLGAEGEYASEILGLNEKSLSLLDYIIVPHSHTHMKGFVLPTDCIDNPKKHAEYLVKSFISLCNHEKRNLFFGIAHPMWPIGVCLTAAEDIYSYITDEELKTIALTAAKNDIAIEVNISCVINVIYATDGKRCCYNRFYDACKSAGCKFFLGSDAHSTEAFIERHEEASQVLNYLGLDESDFTVAKLQKPNE